MTRSRQAKIYKLWRIRFPELKYIFCPAASHLLPLQYPALMLKELRKLAQRSGLD